MSKSFQYVFLHLLWILNMSGFERSSLVRMAEASFYQSRIFLGTNFFWWKNYIFVIFWCCGPNTFTRRRWTFRQSSPICVFVFRKSSWKKTFLEKTFFNFYSDFEQNVFRLSAVLHNLHFTKFIFYFQNKMLESKKYWEKKSLVFVSQFCTAGFRTSDEDGESIFSQLPWNRVKVFSICFHLLFMVLNMSDFERSSFGKKGKSIILPVEIFVWGEMFFRKKNYKFVLFLHFRQKTFTRRT